MKPRVTSFAPQFLVEDLARSIAYYRKIGFTFGDPWEGFYAIGYLDGFELHLKEAPKNDAERQHRRENDHLDASAGVDGIDAFYEQCVANGVTILKPLAETAWGTKDFYVEDPDGHIISFCGGPEKEVASAAPAEIAGISPFFIVRDVPTSLAFYRDRLGFEITFEGPEPDDIFFGIVRRGRAQILMKAVGVAPVPNYTRDIKQGIARWDAFVSVPDPDALAAEFASRNVELFEPLKDTHDGLRGFEVKDAEGYLLFFGRPR